MRRFTTPGLVSTAVLCVLSWSSSVLSQNVYVAGSANEFGTVNLASGAFTSIGALALPAGDNMYGMGFTSSGLYGLDSDPNSNLYRIDPSTAALTNLGAVGQSSIGASAGPNNTLVTLSQDVNAILYTVTPPAAGAGIVGNTGLLDADGLVASGAGGSLFAGEIDSVTPQDDLYSINTSTGAATLIGGIGFQSVNTGLFVDGALYGFTSNNQIISINTATGAGALVSTYSLPNGDLILAAAAAPTSAVPEGGAVVMAGGVCAFFMLLLAASRKVKRSTIANIGRRSGFSP